jgi:hypothetical protein
MAASAPCQKRYIASRIVVLSDAEAARVELVRLWVVPLVHMDVPEIIRHECAFINGLVSNSEIVDKVSAEDGAGADGAERLADDTFYNGHLVLPGGHWDRGETLMDWFAGGCVGIGGEETLDFGDSLVFPRVVGTQLNESPAC